MVLFSVAESRWDSLFARRKSAYEMPRSAQHGVNLDGVEFFSIKYTEVWKSFDPLGTESLKLAIPPRPLPSNSWILGDLLEGQVHRREKTFRSVRVRFSDSAVNLCQIENDFVTPVERLHAAVFRSTRFRLARDSLRTSFKSALAHGVEGLSSRRRNADSKASS